MKQILMQTGAFLTGIAFHIAWDKWLKAPAVRLKDKIVNNIKDRLGV